MTRKSLALIAFVAMLVATLPASGSAVEIESATGAVVVAQSGGTTGGELQPRYKPVPPEEESWYNDSYIFAFTRGVAGSTMHPVAKAPLFLFALPLDIVTLPFTVIGGMFG